MISLLKQKSANERAIARCRGQLLSKLEDASHFAAETLSPWLRITSASVHSALQLTSTRTPTKYARNSKAFNVALPRRDSGSWNLQAMPL